MRIALLLCLISLTGCARDEFDLLQPAALKTHIGRDDRVTIDQPPLTYGLLADHSRLSVRIDNPTTQPVSLRADQSYAVDAGGQSRRVQGITIAPQSFAKLLLPLPKPYVDGSDSTYVGIETSGGFHHGAGIEVGDEEVGPSEVENLDDNTYWEWPRDGIVTLHFAYRSAGSNWANDLTLKRVKP